MVMLFYLKVYKLWFTVLEIGGGERGGGQVPLGSNKFSIPHVPCMSFTNHQETFPFFSVPKSALLKITLKTDINQNKETTKFF